ncbi:MAG: sulfotransferase, partial [Patescibacteria group bacterium]|nr:sulfotransferase [Patescibacteria group bacterium]
MNNIFLFGAPKSGTTLLQSLLDSHTELFVLPIELRYFQHKGFPSVIYQHQGFKSLNDFKLLNNFDEIKRNILDHKVFKNLVSKDIKYPNNFDLSDFNFKITYKLINNIDKCDNEHDFIELLFKSFFCAHKISHEQKYEYYKIVEKTPMQEEFALDIAKLFLDAKFIHIIRNPYAHAVTLRKRMLSLGNFYPIFNKRIVEIIKGTYYFLERNMRLLDNYCLIKFEDLLNYPEEEMKKIAYFIGVDFDKTLLEPTIGGKPWFGNSAYSKVKFTEINKAPTKKWKEEITDYEIAMINKNFMAVLKKYYYDEILRDKNKKIFYKNNKESIKTYIY